MRGRVRVDQADGQTRALDAAGGSIRLGRDAACEVAVDPIAFPKVSGVQARIEPAAEGFALVHLSRRNRTLVHDVPVDGSVPVRVGAWIRLGFTGPTIAILAMDLLRAKPEPYARFSVFLRQILRWGRLSLLMRVIRPQLGLEAGDPSHERPSSRPPE
jgi:hypothetical protein